MRYLIAITILIAAWIVLAQEEENENYWQHLDFIVDEAVRNGLYTALFSMWGRDVSRLFPDPDLSNYLYASTLARRYRDRSHILWAVCGEYEKIRDDWKTDSQITGNDSERWEYEG